VLGVSVPKKSKMTAASGMSPFSASRQLPGRLPRGSLLSDRDEPAMSSMSTSGDRLISPVS